MPLGTIAFLGSGETSLAGGRIFESLARIIPDPLHVAALETPAGFELNSAQVAGRVAEFLASRLQNYKPTVDVIPARKKGTDFNPDDADILAPLLDANMIFMGPGSPTYAIRQLKDSLAWEMIRARHRMGATLVFASAAAISIGAYALPVYEIYKAGHDVHLADGLNLFDDFGMRLSFIPHWNNAEGGLDLDTSRCFMGMERFEQWCSLLPKENTIVGLDEHTGLIVDFEAGMCEVKGVSSVSIVRECDSEIYPAGAKFSLDELGQFHAPEPIQRGIRADAWDMIHAMPRRDDQPPAKVLDMLEQRKNARAKKDFAESDRLRDLIASHGWDVQDGKGGQKLTRKQPQ